MRWPVISSLFTKFKRSPAMGLTFLLVCAHAGPLVRAQSPELIVKASFAGKQAITSLEQIDLSLNRPLEPVEGRLAVFIGSTDMTALFKSTPNGLNYAPKSLHLPGGENVVTVYLVSRDDSWREIAQFTLRVSKSESAETRRDVSEAGTAKTTQKNAGQTEGRLVFDRVAVIPSLTVSLESQPAETHFPDSAGPARPRYIDFDFQSSIQTDLVNAPLGFQTQFDFVGTSFREKALRYGELGDEAPQIDLSSFLMQFQIKKARLLIGHVSTGSNRHLINSFSSRGITLTLPVNKRSDLTFAAMNGTSIVGWNNFIGLKRSQHQIQSATLGHEFLPSRPGGLRVEASLLYGSLLPQSNFNQGNITDAERSSGFGVRVVASDPTQRLRLDGGYARSKFTNPEDPLLNQGTDVVPVQPTTRQARYLDVAYDLLKEHALTKNTRANLSVAFRHERVDPLYRSVAAYTQADRQQDQLEMVGQLSDLSVNFMYGRFKDNLANIPSVLKTLTRSNAFLVSAPLNSFFGDRAQPRSWLPRISYSRNRTHQFAVAFPSNGAFELNPSTVPDQLSTNQSFAADWQGGKWRFGYRFNHSFQDNRQTGRELSDLKNILNGIVFGISPYRSLELNFDFTADRAHNREMQRTDRGERAGLGINWRIAQRSSLAANISTAFAGDVSRASNSSRNAQLNLQWVWGFGVETSRLQRMRGQFVIRYANHYARSRDFLFGFNNLLKSQTINAGMSLTFF